MSQLSKLDPHKIFGQQSNPNETISQQRTSSLAAETKLILNETLRQLNLGQNKDKRPDVG